MIIICLPEHDIKRCGASILNGNKCVIDQEMKILKDS